MKRPDIGSWLLFSVLVVGLILSLAIATRDSWWGNRTRLEARQFWKLFCDKNSAWLDPGPPPFSYETVIEEKAFDYEEHGYRYREVAVGQTWYVPEASVRFVWKGINENRETLWVEEERYLEGEGNRLTIPPQIQTVPLGWGRLLMARTGCAFLTPLHRFCRSGLPENSVIEPVDASRVRLRVTGLLGNAGRLRNGEPQARYGFPGPAFGRSLNTAPETVEVEIDRKSFLPIRLSEWLPDGQVCTILHFDTPWLKLRGQRVPATVRCHSPFSHNLFEYHFSVQSGIWILDEVVHKPSRESLVARAVTRSVSPGFIPRENFILPTDVDLPAHSETVLREGERIVTFETEDGLVLEGKLSVPKDTAWPVPVVFFLPGTGPWTFDRPIEYPDVSSATEGSFPRMKVRYYCDFLANELARRGIALFRINKRGCAVVKEKPYERVNRSIFSKVTPSVLLADYRAALNVLREQVETDANRIILLAGSEGSLLAPRLALASPEGIVGIVMLGYVEDNAREMLVWQNTEGSWRTVARVFDADEDGRVMETEFSEILAELPPPMRPNWSFGMFDRDEDGALTPKDTSREERLEEILRAVREGDDDFLWKNVHNLSSAYLIEDWDREPNHKALLKLDIPLAIFHGEYDGVCRVEGVREAGKAFQETGRDNLTVNIYPKTDHDLNWGQYLRTGEVPPAFADIFDTVRQLAVKAD